jgi:hypothetical protein
MSYNQLPPPPPDRVGMPPGGPYGGPQLARPGGAYGPIEHSPSQPVPGQLPPPEMTMAKPRSILGIQVILWIFTAIAAIGDLFSVMSLVEYGNPLTLLSLAYSVYATIQAVLSPAQIERGKRWVWIWNVVNSAIATVGALAIILISLPYADVTPVPILIGLAIGGLQGTLFVLLLTRSARDWITMHRIERGEIKSIGVLAPGARGVLVRIAAERPATKPGSVTFVQLAVWLLALLPLVWIWVGLRRAEVVFERGLEEWEEPASSAFDYFMQTDYMLFGILGSVAFTVLATLAIISAVSLQRGRFWTRVYTPIWVGPAAVAGSMWVIAMSLEVLDLEGESDNVELFSLAKIALTAGILFTVLAVLAFIVVFLRGVRSWAPGQQTVISYEAGAQGQPLPGPPPAPAMQPGRPQGYAAQQRGYQAPQGYPQQPHQAPQQPGPYGAPQQGSYPRQQPPYPPRY